MPGKTTCPTRAALFGFGILPEAHNLSLQSQATFNATLAAVGLLLRSGTVVDVTQLARECSVGCFPREKQGSRLA